MTALQHRSAGRRGALLDLPEDLEPASLAVVLRRLADRLGVRLTEVVPGAVTLLVQAEDPAGLRRVLEALDDDEVAGARGDVTTADLETVTLEVRYDGPDLSAVAEASGLDAAEVVRRHVAGEYAAAFTGFAPGFAYLTGLDPALRLPRRDTPRPVVPAGALAVADAYTAVYPRRSPGGWHLIGTVETAMFDPERDPAALISPGQSVRFVERS